jgi:hypothetical protein
MERKKYTRKTFTRVRSLPKHGTNGEYMGYGCRCDDCKIAARKYEENRRRARGIRPRRETVRIRKTAEHGTTLMYNRGCHCVDCKTAWAKYKRERWAMGKETKGKTPEA